jgi:hypothetical protein
MTLIKGIIVVTLFIAVVCWLYRPHLLFNYSQTDVVPGDRGIHLEKRLKRMWLGNVQ